MLEGKVLIAQGGGPTAVINASASGVIEAVRRAKGRIGRLYAARNGILGALNEELIDTSKESVAAIRALKHTPGAAFGSCRYKLKSPEEDRAKYERLVEVLRAHDIGWFFYNGGNDSADTTLKLSKISAAMGYPLNAIGVPKTIDNDLVGTELSSILKNVYAIIIGIVDAHYNSPNLRSLVLTRSINEMRYLLSRFGGKERTVFNYCGFGDFSLTALNDMSRNRTLGLLIGKGFFTDYISEKVVLEGKIATNTFVDKIARKRNIRTQELMLKELYQVFNDKQYDITNFVNRLLAANPIKEDLFTWF